MRHQTGKLQLGSLDSVLGPRTNYLNHRCLCLYLTRCIKRIQDHLIIILQIVFRTSFASPFLLVYLIYPSQQQLFQGKKFACLIFNALYYFILFFVFLLFRQIPTKLKTPLQVCNIFFVQMFIIILKVFIC